jgi:hypothetical protein
LVDEEYEELPTETLPEITDIAHGLLEPLLTSSDLSVAFARLPKGIIECIELVRRPAGELTVILRVPRADGTGFERQHHSLGAFAGGWR